MSVTDHPKECLLADIDRADAAIADQLENALVEIGQSVSPLAWIATRRQLIAQRTQISAIRRRTLSLHHDDEWNITLMRGRLSQLLACV